MSDNFLIIISGRPATGKTTLGRKISKYLNVPILCRDDIKESLFDSLGFNDREQSRKIGGASFKLLYDLTEKFLNANTPLIVETFFHPEHDRDKFSELKSKYNLRLLEINCIAKADIRHKRFINRNESGERHPGHVDHFNYDQSNGDSNDKETGLLDIGDERITVDTSNFETLDYENIFNKIKSYLMANE